MAGITTSLAGERTGPEFAVDRTAARGDDKASAHMRPAHSTALFMTTCPDPAAEVGGTRSRTLKSRGATPARGDLQDTAGCGSSLDAAFRVALKGPCAASRRSDQHADFLRSCDNEPVIFRKNGRVAER